ncbi:MAG: signal peptidase I [Nitrospirota bacterium]|nr:signal peptidase I [Nitrospirota bacterium]
MRWPFGNKDVARHEATPREDDHLATPVHRHSRVREYAEAIAIAVVLALVIRTYVVQAYKIPSGSMLETLQIGDHLLVNKFLYGTRLPFSDKRILPLRQPVRGDIIVFAYPEDESKDFIKRIIGLPGDTIEVVDKQVYINGDPYTVPQEQHLDRGTIPAELQPRDFMAPVTVPPDSYFVMGDNRDHSLDSRFWGFVEMRQIHGKAVIIYWSWGDNWPRFGRLGNLIR